MGLLSAIMSQAIISTTEIGNNLVGFKIIVTCFVINGFHCHKLQRRICAEGSHRNLKGVPFFGK